MKLSVEHLNVFISQENNITLFSLMENVYVISFLHLYANIKLCLLVEMTDTL